RYGAAAWPLVSVQQRLPRKVFRRSLAGLPDSLSTLRRAGYPDPTQDSLPAVGQTLLGGRSTRRVPTKGFRGVIVTSLPPFPSLLGANTSTGGTCGDAIVAASPRISSPSDGWFGVANEQFHAGCEATPEC